jgi:quinoprotein glucose dehydrogenase
MHPLKSLEPLDLPRDRARRAICTGMVLGLLSVRPGAQSDWPTYGNDAGHQRHSTLTQITPGNVRSLAPAWMFDTGVAGRKWLSTPIVVNNRMFLTLPRGGVVALEPETGRVLWRFDATVTGRIARAVSYWPGEAAFGARLLYGAGDRIIALDPVAGTPIESFGNRGVAIVHPGAPAGQPSNDSFSISSPPAIYKHLAIVGGSLSENAHQGPPGDPQAIDVRTGRIVWRFHAVPRPGEPGHESWGAGWQDRGGPSLWGLITVDIERGVVFLPFGNPGGSFYGGDRPGDNLYSASVVALDAETGAYKWHYQTTRHDLWDADLAAAPALVEVTKDARRLQAVAIVTKMGGMVFLLDRETGKPIYPVEERAVPASDVPGEVVTRTQPFPTRPAPWARLSMTRGDLTTVTPESQKFCTEWWDRERMHNEGAYTPYGATGTTVVFSGTVGGGNWGGGSFHPGLGYFIVNTSNLGTIGRMTLRANGLYQNELAYTRFWDDSRYPCQQPPWGELVAVNVNTGEIAWRVPFGIYEALVKKGIPTTGTPNLGGPITTSSGLVFIGATKDQRFRAFDARTGQELWSIKLDAAAVATPMTYLGRNGKQYVVVAAGGPGDTDRGGTENYPQRLYAFSVRTAAPR